MKGRLRDPSSLWDRQQTGNERFSWAGVRMSKRNPSNFETVKEFKEEATPVKVVGNITVDDVIEDRLEPPLDLQTFGRFCKAEFNQENLEFYLAVRVFKKIQPTGQDYLDTIKRINSIWIHRGGEAPINISDKTRDALMLFEEKQKEEVSSDRQETDEKQKLKKTNNGVDAKYKIYDRAATEVKKLMAMDIFRRFQGIIVLKAKIREARSQALWCCNRESTPNIRSFFKYPNPVDVVHARLHRFVITVLLISGVVENFFTGGFVLFSVAFGSLSLRAACGSRLDPSSFIVLFGLDPIVNYTGLMHTKYVKNKARRFADILGALVVASIAIAAAFQLNPAVWALSGFWILGGFIHLFSEDS